MDIEYEATFTEIDKDKIRRKLEEIEASLEKPEFLQKRTVFALPKNHHLNNGWLRVRDEGDKITLSLKDVGKNIEDQKEICLEVNDYNEAVKLIENLGFDLKAYQETRRELWKIDGVEVTIDEWPFLDPIIEIEGESAEKVRKVSEKLGFNWGNAKFCAAGDLYAEKYNISARVVNDETPEIVFDMKNPFV